MSTIGINTYAYAWTTPAIDTVRRLSDLGYRTFELLVHPPHLPIEDFSPASRRELAWLLSRIGAVDCAMNLPSLDHNMASAWSRVRKNTIAMFEDTIDLAADLGIPWLVTVPGRISALSPASVEDRTSWVRDCIETLLPHAEKRGVGLAIENVPFASFPDATSLGAFVRGFGSKSIAACYDAANAHYVRDDPAEGIRQLADVLRIVHVSDTPQDVWRHDPVGTGTVPFAEVAKALAEIGFDGPIMLEVIGEDPEAAITESHDLLAKVGFPAESCGEGGMTRGVLITGAAGLLGRFVVEEMLAHNYDVRGLDRRAGAAAIDWRVGDVTDPAFVAEAVDGMDAVLHIAAVPNIWSGDGQTIMRVNVLGNYTVFEAAEAAGIERAVFCSSDSVAGYTVREGRMLPPLYAPLDLEHPLLATDPYAVSKVLGEDLARAYALRGMSVVALRTVFVAYPEMAGEIAARARDPDAYRGPAVGGPSSAGGGPLHHHIDPRDVARAFRLAAEFDMRPGEFERFFLSAQVTLSPEPTLDRLRRLHGGSVEVRDPSIYEKQPFAPLYDLGHAAERLGFVAEHDQRHLIAGATA